MKTKDVVVGAIIRRRRTGGLFRINGRRAQDGCTYAHVVPVQGTRGKAAWRWVGTIAEDFELVEGGGQSDQDQERDIL